MPRLSSLRRTFHTLRYLTPRQAFFFIWRRGIGARPAPPVDISARCRPLQPDFAVKPAIAPASAHADAARHEFTFLNETLDFPADKVDWNPASANRLWRYNLHYFDFLLDQGRPVQARRQLIQHWIDHNPPGSEPAWEPYTASLRIVNWCRFFWSQREEGLPATWLQSLHQQVGWLERNLEYHILANHLFENIKALVFGGVFFEGAAAARWLRTGQRLLREQLAEQQLPDGGHYERSPQYHCILLEDKLDLFALAKAAPELFDASTSESLRSAIDRAQQLLDCIATPDDDIPLFNDSASGSAPPPSAIRQRAQVLGFDTRREAPPLIDCPDTGIYGWKSASDYFAIDCGDIGPAYQPGHTHCDFLSYVLMMEGEWLVVDSGVCEYAPGPMRHYVRSTAAHNTVDVGGQEQSEIWGEFRVARRARRLAADIAETGASVVFEGAYRGFPGIAGGVVHRRRVVLSREGANVGQLAVEDSLAGSGHFPIRSFVHLHPAVSAEVRGTTATLYRGEKEIATLHASGAAIIDVESGWYCPRFGVKEANTVLVMRLDATLPSQPFGYVLRRSTPHPS